MKDIQESFDQTLTNTNLPDVGIDIAELSIDHLIDNPVLQGLPIVNTFIGFIQLGANIHDRLFLKKIISFLNGISQIDEAQRKKMIGKTDRSKKYRMKVGEKLLYILDSCKDYEGAERIAKLFAAFLAKQINYDQYLEASSIVAQISQKELNDFLRSYSSVFIHDDVSHLMHTGLLSVDFEEITIDVEPMRHDSVKLDADVNGGQLIISPTDAGDTIYQVFGRQKGKTGN
jgi:hypothetical protein